MYVLKASSLKFSTQTIMFLAFMEKHWFYVFFVCLKVHRAHTIILKRIKEIN